MSYLASKKSIIFMLLGLFLLGVGLTFVNWFVYPFGSARPNFADVEAVYSKMQVPGSWTKTGEGANKGIAGRQCGIESDGCFSKSATFTVPQTVTVEEIKKVYEGMGCVSVVVDRTEPKGAKPYTDFECTTGGLKLYGTLDEKNNPWEMVVGVASR